MKTGGIGAFLRRPEIWAVLACVLLILGFWLGSALTLRNTAEVAVVSSRSAEVRELPAAAEPVNVNKADRETLCTLPGIGSALADRILAYRQEHGPFRQLPELMNVRGIGSKTYEGLLGLITLD